MDGGVVNSIPLSRALELGATEIYVLHVGHIDEPLWAPEQPWQVAMAAFKISRRHGFARDLASVPDDVTVHVLPTGNPSPGTYSDPSKLRWGDFTKVTDRIAAAHRGTHLYLEAQGTARKSEPSQGSGFLLLLLEGLPGLPWSLSHVPSRRLC